MKSNLNSTLQLMMRSREANIFSGEDFHRFKEASFGFAAEFFSLHGKEPNDSQFCVFTMGWQCGRKAAKEMDHAYEDF